MKEKDLIGWMLNFVGQLLFHTTVLSAIPWFVCAFAYSEWVAKHKDFYFLFLPILAYPILMIVFSGLSFQGEQMCSKKVLFSWNDC